MKEFITKNDGTFWAHMGEVILKSTKVGDTEGWDFNGVASTPDKDREGEVILQEGLNFDPFREHGEFNWNHIPHAMVGVPTGKKAYFEKGRWMCEGTLLKGMPIHQGYTTDMVVQQHNQLQKSGFQRGLACSIEGKVTERSKCGKYVKKADIYNVALTFRPVNPGCTISMIAKSMMQSLPIHSNDEFFYEIAKKSLGVQEAKPFTKEDLEGAGGSNLYVERALVSHLVKKGMDEKSAIKRVRSYMRKKFLGKRA